MLSVTNLVPLLSVAAGGAIGAGLRYFASLALINTTRFPYATLLVNILGCFLAGLLVGGLLTRLSMSPNIQLLLTTGLLGGFTTFSAFSVDTLRLAESGQWALAGVNVMLNIVGCLMAVGIGWWVARSLLA